jgi:hypothetical protein
MSSSESPDRSKLEYGFNSSLLDRVTAIANLRDQSFGDGMRNGVALLHIWDGQRARGQLILGNTGITIIDSGIVEENIESPGVKLGSLGRIAALVEMEKQSYDAVDTVQTLYVTDDFRLRVDLYCLSQGYSDQNPAFRDAALFFCNLHEILQQRSEQ